MSSLSKGLSFCPTPPFLNIQEIECDLRKFERASQNHTVPPHNVSAPDGDNDGINEESAVLHSDHSVLSSESSCTSKSDRNRTVNTYISTITYEINERCSQVSHENFRANFSK